MKRCLVILMLLMLPALALAEGSVYVRPERGVTYHWRADCMAIDEFSTVPMAEVTSAQAEELGYLPCSVCAEPEDPRDCWFYTETGAHHHNTLRCPLIASADRELYLPADGVVDQIPCPGCLGMTVDGEIGDLTAWADQTIFTVPEDFFLEAGGVLYADDDLAPGMYTAVTAEDGFGALRLFDSQGSVLLSVDMTGGATCSFLLCEQQAVELPEHCVLSAVSEECVPQEEMEAVIVGHARMLVAHELGGFTYCVTTNGPDAWYEVTTLVGAGDGFGAGRVAVQDGETTYVDLQDPVHNQFIELYNCTLWVEQFGVG